MAEQNSESGAVDPRPPEMNTGSQTGQAPVDIKTDAAGKALGAATTAPKASATVVEDAPAHTEVSEVVAAFGNDDKDTKAAIINLSSGIKSVSNTGDMVTKADTQSTDMQTGAQVAHDNAVQSLGKRFTALCEKVGEEVATEVKDILSKLHDAEEVVENALKVAGVIAR